jgi:hypothetical protein
MVDWGRFLQELRSFPANVHNLRPPCPVQRLKHAEGCGLRPALETRGFSGVVGGEWPRVPLIS